MSTSGARTATYSYDVNGNLKSDGQSQYSWDGLDRLIRITLPDGKTTQIAYDALGRPSYLLHKSGQGTGKANLSVSWCGGPTPCASSNTSNLPEVVAGEVVFVLQGEWRAKTGTPNLLYVTDHQGSVVSAQDASGNGNTLSASVYTANGQTSVQTGALNTIPQFGYAGMYRLPYSGLYLTPNRVYSPNDVRWLNRDPIEEAGGDNLYGYVGAASSEQLTKMDCRHKSYHWLFRPALLVSSRPVVGR